MTSKKTPCHFGAAISALVDLREYLTFYLVRIEGRIFFSPGLEKVVLCYKGW